MRKSSLFSWLIFHFSESLDNFQVFWQARMMYKWGHSLYIRTVSSHTIYTRNNMGQKCEGNCGLWVINEIIENIYPANLKKMW